MAERVTLQDPIRRGFGETDASKKVLFRNRCIRRGLCRAPRKPVAPRARALGKTAVSLPLLEGCQRRDQSRCTELKESRAKFVLDLCGTSRGSRRAETPNLVKAFKSSRKNGRFVTINLSLDKEVGPPKKYPEERDPKRIQGFLSDWSATSVPLDYELLRIPAISLIGPDGRIIAAVRNALPRK